MKIKVFSALILMIICLAVGFPAEAAQKNQEYDYLLDITMEKMKEAGHSETKIPIDNFGGTEEEADAFGMYIYTVYDFTSDLKVYKHTTDGVFFSLFLGSDNLQETYIRQNQAVLCFEKNAQEVEHLTDLEKVTEIHDWLVETIEYDNTYGKNSVYSAVVQGISACNGYGRSFQIMCDISGIECESIIGTANNQKHIWNRVKVDGAWKYVDVTWNDQSGTKTWFLVSKECMDRNHTPENQ